jgi:hypothetical protein
MHFIPDTELAHESAELSFQLAFDGAAWTNLNVRRGSYLRRRSGAEAMAELCPLT